MRKILLCGALVSLFCLQAGSAFAILTNGFKDGTVVIPENPASSDSIYLGYWSDNGGVNGGNSGGPFYAYDNTTKQGWETFCIEAGTNGGDELFSPGTTYQLDKLTGVTSSVATLSGNVVTDAAKWLYYTAMTDPVAIGYNPASATAATDLQEAIWHGVLHGGVPLNTPFDAGAAALFAFAPAVWADASQVGVINPATTDANYDTNAGRDVQSMLYIASTAHESTPEPASLIVWSVLGAGAAGAALRRRQKAGRWSADNRQAISALIEGKLHS